jgi:ABC-type spermidine/putrescine transport system permease subunit II
LLSPLLIIVPISFSSSSFLTFPPPGVSLRWYHTVLGDAEWLSAIWQSVKIASLSAIFSVTVGTGAALSIVKMASKTRAMTLQFLLAPLIVPSIVGSVALYFLFAKMHLVGTLIALVLAHSVAAVPVVVLIVAAGLQGVDPRLERAAASLGAPPLTTLRAVTLPLVLRSLFVAGFVAFLHSFDEVVYALFLSGPRLVTLPIRMWSGIRDEISPAIAAVSTLLIALIVLVYVVSEISRRRQARRRDLQSFRHAAA